MNERSSDVWVPIATIAAIVIDMIVAFSLVGPRGAPPSRGVLGVLFVFVGTQGVAFSVWRLRRPSWPEHRFWSAHPYFANWFARIPLPISGEKGERINAVVGIAINAIGLGFGLARLF
jgi:hypothetical protein